MNVRLLRREDIPELRRIHETFFKDQFEFKMDHCLAAFVVEDSKGIISAGGIKSIVESIQVSDQERERITRAKALLLMEMACKQAARNLDYDQLHVFINDKNYESQLLKNDWKLSKGNCLVLDI